MGLFGPSKKEQALQAEVDRLKAMLTPEQSEAVAIQNNIKMLELQKETIEKEIETTNKRLAAIQSEYSKTEALTNSLKASIPNLREEIDMSLYGVYRPTYEFATSDLYKDRLKQIRDYQKNLIKTNQACTGNMNWTVNNSKSQGNKMVKDMQKLLLRAFNNECDDIVRNVKLSNVDKSRERIRVSAGQISNLGQIMSISITQAYINSKYEELALALDFAQKKQEEKERIKEERERQREEAKAQKEIEEARKKLQKEQTHYKNALAAITEQLVKNPDDPDLLAKKAEIESNIAETDKAIADVDYREANKRAGYVYIISNIGAFGENVYKIGMTRRLEPMDRVNELGDASVPFNFDVHALIFTDDAPGLEAALHNAFEKNKVNKINPRREFFRVSLDDIKRVVRENFDKTVEWVDTAEAEQYRQSIALSK